MGNMWVSGLYGEGCLVWEGLCIVYGEGDVVCMGRVEGVGELWYGVC